MIDASGEVILMAGQWSEAPTGPTLESLVADGILWRAWDRVRHNHGAPGVDGETVEAFEAGLWQRLPFPQADLLAGWNGNS